MEFGPDDGVALGAYVRGYPTDGAALDRYARLVGRWPALVHIFRNWTDTTRDFDADLADGVTRGGAALMISWQPPAGSLAAIAAGEHDGYVRDYARAVRAWGGNVLLRFAHEMNGEWIPWHAEPAAYRDAWRRLHAIFGEEGADSVAWVWSPHVPDARAAQLNPYFPGDDVVDWMALDGYNWGSSQAATRWQGFDEIFADAYRDIVELAPDTPLMLAEIGCAEDGGDKAAWIRNGYREVYDRLPDIGSIMYLHADLREIGHPDWRLTSPSAAMGAYAEIAGLERFSGRSPFSARAKLAQVRRERATETKRDRKEAKQDDAAPKPERERAPRVHRGSADGGDHDGDGGDQSSARAVNRESKRRKADDEPPAILGSFSR